MAPGRHPWRGTTPAPAGSDVATWNDVRRIARDLPEAVEDSSGRTTAWRVGGKAFAWERLLRRGEREQLGDAAPAGPALGLRTDAVETVDALVASRPGVFFTVAGYAFLAGTAEPPLDG